MIFLLVGLAVAAPVDLSTLVNTPLAGAGANDAICLRGQGRAKLPPNVRIPLGGASGAVQLTWVMPDGVRVEDGPAATVTATYASGGTAAVNATPGVEIGGASSRGVEPITLPGPGGKPLAGSRWLLPLPDTATPLRELTVTMRPGRRSVCVTAVDVAPSPLALTHYAGPDWYPFPLATSLPDTRARPLPVEAPAGAHGRLGVGADGHLVFADGTRARFWGVNTVGLASVPPRDDADRVATTLATLGFNLVRIHHYDGVPPRGVVNAARTGDADLFDTRRLDDLDWFVSRLREHGIYLLLEVATERELTAADGVSDPGGAPNGHKLYPMWEDDWSAAYLHWFERMWGRTNPYTKLRYADDPAVALVELSNEHSLLMNWGFGLERVGRVHLERLDVRWNAWLRTKYADDAAIAAAWAGSDNPGLRPGESLTAGTVAREPFHPAVLSAWPDNRARDLYRFYRELEEAFYQRVADEAKALGFRVPLVPSISYDQPILTLSQAPWPVNDIHVSYGGMRGSTAFEADSALADPAGVLKYVASAVSGKAMMVSELSHLPPNRYRAEGPLLWAALASVQDWDALVWFSYADGAIVPDVSGLPGTNDIRTTPVIATQLPTASALFRSGAIAPATGRYDLALPPAVVEGRYLQPDAHAFSASDLPWQVTDPRFALTHRVRRTLTAASAEVPGAPGSVGWHPSLGVMVIDTPGVQARVGPPGAVGEGGVGPTAPSRLGVGLDRWASVALASLDGRPLGESRRALLTVATTQENEGQRYANGGADLYAIGIAPARVAPVHGVVTFAWPAQPTVVALDGAGAEGAALPVAKAGKGWWSVDLSGAASPWFLVRDP